MRVKDRGHMQPVKRVQLTIEIPPDDIRTDIVWDSSPDDKGERPTPPLINTSVRRLTPEQQKEVARRLREYAAKVREYLASKDEK
jgi:hypothetical protein